jgi:aminocarboxymuconate-semialdehyde decarboxylase
MKFRDLVWRASATAIGRLELAMSDECIDIFCHCLPLAFCAAVEELRREVPFMFRNAATIPVMTDVEARLRVMDQFPGYQQVLSLASPTIEALAGPEQSPALTRAGNDALAAMVRGHPERFPGFIASLPMNNMDAALQEARRAVADLGAVGVQVYTNVNGRPLDEPEFLPLFGLMAELRRPIWLHPIRPMTFADYANEKVSKYDLWWAFGWPYESSVAMARLVFAGVFDRWPNLAIITHHMGGIVPLMEGRLGPGMHLLGQRNPPEHASAVKTDLKEPLVQAMKRFYADTASFGVRAPIECGLAFFGLDRMLFATDMPFDPEQGPGFIRDILRAIGEMDLTSEQRQAILSGNARRLLRLNGN